MLRSTLFHDPLADKRFDFQFDNPPYGIEWSKDYDTVITREPMQNNPSVCQRFGQRLASAASNRKPCRHCFLHPSPFSPFPFQSGQLFSSMQIPVCLEFLAKKTHDGPLVVNEKALSYAL